MIAKSRFTLHLVWLIAVHFIFIMDNSAWREIFRSFFIIPMSGKNFQVLVYAFTEYNLFIIPLQIPLKKKIKTGQKSFKFAMSTKSAMQTHESEFFE